MMGKVVRLQLRPTAADRERALIAFAERCIAFEVQVEAGLLTKIERVSMRAQLRRELLEINANYQQLPSQ